MFCEAVVPNLFIKSAELPNIRSFVTQIAKISMTASIDSHVLTRAPLASGTKDSFVRWLANLNYKRNLTSVFENRYLGTFQISSPKGCSDGDTKTQTTKISTLTLCVRIAFQVDRLGHLQDEFWPEKIVTSRL